ncbi:MAG TPA: ECF-type sigma factor [Phycisphaerae bacterium]|nr:sigma-70 family RNA polymerase sigma factor [Phycisphaerales bacterium]HRX86393.1 ECF-type sigma factor [Phycisphaerae bacterium]
MSIEADAGVTLLLERIRAGDRGARDELFRLVYAELRAQAERHMQIERDGHTLQVTALVHEAFLKLCAGSTLARAENRRYFFGAAAEAMRQVLVDHARARKAQKRGGAWQRISLDEMLAGAARAASPHPVGDDPADACAALLGLDDALAKLAQRSPRQHQVVLLRFFGGLNFPELAKALNLSKSTVELEFRVARAWLRTELA